jgi:hypothetical protein
MDLDLVSRGIQNGFVGFGSGIGGRSDQTPTQARRPLRLPETSVRVMEKDPELKWAAVDSNKLPPR